MKDKKNIYSYNNYYTDGNAAKKLHELPRYNEEERVQVLNTPSKRKKTRVAPKPAIDFFSIIILSAAIALTLFTCVEYLRVQSGIVQMHNDIAKLESELTKLQNKNNAAQALIDTSLDLNYIYQYATTKLGMVYPNENQVITYDSTLGSYVRQYDSIPSGKESSFFDKFKR